MQESQRERLRSLLVSTAGGYLRNPVRQDFVTCAVCTTPSSGYRLCSPCNRQRCCGQPLADAVAPLSYAVAGRQSGYVMRGYKAQPPLDEHRAVVALLIILALTTHSDCAAEVVRTRLTHWATVPSLPAKPGEHPLHKIVSGVMPEPEVSLTAAASVANARDLNRDHFHVASRLTSGSHVLLLDDTWTSGGHAQSAVLALRDAGANHVSVLVVARWIREDFGDNAQFLRDLSDYDPAICPWTGAECP